MALTSRNNSLGLQISSSIVHPLCQRFSELLLLCLPQANKVTFYFVGSVPHLKITRLGMAARNQETNEIHWSTSSQMDSDISGKCWKDFRDCSTEPQNVLTYCLRNQKAWTSTASKDDFTKEVGKSCGKLLEKHFYFQPVLMRKADLWHSMPPPSVYPRDRHGEPMWINSDYVMVALIKINLALQFNPFDQNYKQITEELTKTLAIQLLHKHTKAFFSRNIEIITEQKNELKDILITQIRTIMIKLSLINRVVDNELDNLRQLWENIIYDNHPDQPSRINIVKQLNVLLQNLTVDHNVTAESETVKQLTWYQNKLAEFCFLPEENEVWFQQKIVPLWRNTTSRLNAAPDVKKQIKNLTNQLKQSFYVGSNKILIEKIDNIPNSIKTKWVHLAYNKRSLTKIDILNQYIYILEKINFDLPNKRKTLENLVCLKNLAVFLQNLEDQLSKYIDKYEDSTQIDQIYLH